MTANLLALGPDQHTTLSHRTEGGHGAIAISGIPVVGPVRVHTVPHAAGGLVAVEDPERYGVGELPPRRAPLHPDVDLVGRITGRRGIEGLAAEEPPVLVKDAGRAQRPGLATRKGAGRDIDRSLQGSIAILDRAARAEEQARQAAASRGTTESSGG